MSFFEADRSILHSLHSLHSLASSAPSHSSTRHVSLLPKCPWCQRSVTTAQHPVISNSQLEVGKLCSAHHSVFVQEYIPLICRIFLPLWGLFVMSWHDSSSWHEGWMVFLLVPRADTSTAWSRCVSLICLESGVAHILGVAVNDRFSILVADQGQIVDTERKTCTASSKIWTEQLICSLPCCRWEARNQWLVAWDKSNGIFKKELSDIDFPRMKQVFEKWCKEDLVLLRSFLVKEPLWFHAIEAMVSRSGPDRGHWTEDLHGLQQDLNGAVNMFSSLLPLRSKESVIGGLRQEQLAFSKRSSATWTFHTRSRVFRNEQRSWDLEFDPALSLWHAWNPEWHIFLV